MHKDLSAMSSVEDKLAVIDQYDQQRDEWLSTNGSRRGKVLKRWSSQKSNGDQMSTVAREYIQNFEPKISQIKMRVDDAYRNGDKKEFIKQAMELTNIIFQTEPGTSVGRGRWSSSIYSTLGAVTSRNRRILDVDRDLRNELLQIKNWIGQFRNLYQKTDQYFEG